MESPWEGETLNYKNGLGHKIAAMPIYGKNLKNLFQKSDDLQTGNGASGTQGLQILCK